MGERVRVIQFQARDIYLHRYLNSHLGQLCLIIPSWVGVTVLQPKGGDVLRLGSKRQVWFMYGWQVKLSPCYTRCRDKGLIIKRYINSSVYLLYFTLGWAKNRTNFKITHVYDDVERRSMYQNVELLDAVNDELIIILVQYRFTTLVQRIFHCDKIWNTSLTAAKVGTTEQFDIWITFLFHHIHELHRLLTVARFFFGLLFSDSRGKWQVGECL